MDAVRLDRQRQIDIIIDQQEGLGFPTKVAQLGGLASSRRSAGMFVAILDNPNAGLNQSGGHRQRGGEVVGVGCDRINAMQ